MGLKAGTGGLLEAEGLEAIAKDVGAEVSSLGDKYLGEAITKQKEQKAIIEQFREALSDLPSLLSPTEGDKTDTPQKPIVIIIDELDRCRPSFSLEILERIKHFFAVPNVHFVLGVHLGQLENSVKAAYGADIDGRMYLQKFISLSILLVDRKQDDGAYTPIKYARWLAEQLDLPAEDRSFYVDFVGRVAMARHLSLRTQERIFTTIAMTLAFSDSRTLRPAVLVAGLCILRVTDPGLFILAKTGDLRFADASPKLSLDRPKKEGEQIHLDYIIEIWQFCTDTPMTEEQIRNTSRYFQKYFIRDRTSILPHVAGSVMDRYSPPA